MKEFMQISIEFLTSIKTFYLREVSFFIVLESYYQIFFERNL
jgi:hypothetical protein